MCILGDLGNKSQKVESTGCDYRTRITKSDIDLLPTGPEWVTHILEDLLPFWITPAALGDPIGNFPTFRANDGSVIDPENPPKEFVDIGSDDPWLTKRLGRQYTRMVSRQVFAYCVSYHMTGDEGYLQYAKAGVHYIFTKMIDKYGHFYTWIENGKGWPENERQRISQDLAYAIMGPAMYYYITRDPEVLKVLLNTKNYIFDKYQKDNQLRWINEDFSDMEESHLAAQKELVAQLDQINGYLLITTTVLDPKNREAWLKDMLMLANTIKNDYFSEDENLFWGRIDRPECKKLGQPHVDFGHTIKTLWMMYLIGKRFDEKELMDFAHQHMPQVFKEAYDQDMKTWIEKKLHYNEPEKGRDRIWWVHNELDQAAATLALVEPEEYVKYLVTTYRFWFFEFVDPAGKEVWHGLTGPYPGKPMYLKAHLWKNSFHDFEHALMGYITSQALQKCPVDLYYAFVKKPDDDLIQPYLLKGDIKSINVSSLARLNGMKKYKVEFDNIKP